METPVKYTTQNTPAPTTFKVIPTENPHAAAMIAAALRWSEVGENHEWAPSAFTSSQLEEAEDKLRRTVARYAGWALGSTPPDDIAVIVQDVSDGRVDVKSAAGAIRAIGADARLASLAGFVGGEDMPWPVGRTDGLYAAAREAKAAIENLLDIIEEMT